MVNAGMILREAAEEWVKSLNAIPTLMISKLWKVDPEDWSEVTYPEVGNSVYAYNDGSGEIIEANYEINQYIVELDTCKIVELEKEDFEVEHYGQLPMWGTMWSFGTS